MRKRKKKKKYKGRKGGRGGRREEGSQETVMTQRALTLTVFLITVISKFTQPKFVLPVHFWDRQ